MSSRRATTLVVSAWSPEMAPLERALGRQERARVAMRPVGVGLVEAAAGAMRALLETEPQVVIFVGTAGVYPGGGSARSTLPLGAVAAVRLATLGSLAVARELAYFPGPLPTSVASDAALTEALAALAGHPALDVACTLGITRSARAAAALAQGTGARLENLEVFAVARAAHLLGIPFGGVLGITNRVGPRAHAEWKQNAPSASQAACQVVAAWLARDRQRVKAPSRR